MPIELICLAWGTGAVAAARAIYATRHLQWELADGAGARAAWAWMASAVAVLPAIAGVVALIALVVQGGHPVAQLSGSFGAWGMWLHAWMPLLFAHLGAAVILLGTFVLYWERTREPRFFTGRFVGLVTSTFALYWLLRLAPDA